MKIAEFETLVENAAETGHSAWTDAAVESVLMRAKSTRATHASHTAGELCSPPIPKSKPIPGKAV